MWIERIEEDSIYINGKLIKNISTEEGEKELKLALEYERERSRAQGFGSGEGKKTYYAKKTIKNLDMSKEDIIFETSKKRAEQKLKYRRSKK